MAQIQRDLKNSTTPGDSAAFPFPVFSFFYVQVGNFLIDIFDEVFIVSCVFRLTDEPKALLAMVGMECSGGDPGGSAAFHLKEERSSV
jgi:hypothetical protein